MLFKGDMRTVGATGSKLDTAAAQICDRLAAIGVRAMPTAIGFPMDMQPEAGRAYWVLSHKTVAVEAGLGHMGVNRNVIHPRFGNFVLLETVLIDAELDRYDEPLDYNPCMGCNLCVAACPVGAIRKDGDFDFFACLGNNYREFPLGATDWLDAVTASDADSYRAKFREGERCRCCSRWRSGRRTSRLIAWRCARRATTSSRPTSPIGPAIDEDVLVPLIRHGESVYVQSGSRAEKVAARNPSKHIRYLDFDPNVSTAANFALGLRHMFRADGTEPTAYRVAFQFPDGAIVANVDATVVCDDVEYIAILHPHRPG